MNKININDKLEEFEHAGVKINVLIPKKTAKYLEIINENLYPGLNSPVNIHEDKEEIYLITEGLGLIEIGEEKDSVKQGDIIIIPKNLRHAIKNIGKGELSYICISVFTKNIIKDRQKI